MKVCLAVALALLFCATAVRADGSSGVVTYDINGTMTLSGNSSCPTCTETIGFSFDLDSTSPLSPIGSPCNNTLGNGDPCVVGPVTTSSSGPLGVFGSNGSLEPDHGLYVGFFNGQGDEIDLYLGFGNGTSAPVALPSNLFSCDSAVCASDFGGAPPYSFDVSAQLTATDPLATAPEPSSLMLPGMGLAALIGLARIKSSDAFRTRL